MKTYHEPETAQPTATDLAAIIDGIRAEHDARAPADAWRITQRAIRRWTRRRHMKPLRVVARTAHPPTRTPCADADRMTFPKKAPANVHIVR